MGILNDALGLERACDSLIPYALASFKASPAGMSHILLADLVKLFITYIRLHIEISFFVHQYIFLFPKATSSNW